MGSTLGSFAVHATDAATASWVLLVGGAAARPAGFLVLAAVTLTCLLLVLLAQDARIAAAAGLIPLASRAAALREKAWRAGLPPQLDPDRPGRARPRAPSGCPAAA